MSTAAFVVAVVALVIAAVALAGVLALAWRKT